MLVDISLPNHVLTSDEDTACKRGLLLAFDLGQVNLLDPVV